MLGRANDLSDTTKPPESMVCEPDVTTMRAVEKLRFGF